jgi:hypothetical protein
MVKKLTFYLFFFLVFGMNLFAQNNVWHIVEIVDEFGDKTGDKRLAYQTVGTFTNSATTNSNLDILLLVDNPRTVSVVVFEYGKYRVDLNDGLFTYKVGDNRIENVPIEGEYDYSVRRQDGITPHNEMTSLFYLLKQGGLVKFSVYENRSTYRFDVNADNFLKLLSETFINTDSYLNFYDVSDINNKIIKVEFVLTFKWNIERENLLKNNPNIQQIIFEFFKNKDKNFAYDRPGGYYQRDKVRQNWGDPLLENIKKAFPDLNFEYSSFSAM